MRKAPQIENTFNITTTTYPNRFIGQSRLIKPYLKDQPTEIGVLEVGAGYRQWDICQPFNCYLMYSFLKQKGFRPRYHIMDDTQVIIDDLETRENIFLIKAHHESGRKMWLEYLKANQQGMAITKDKDYPDLIFEERLKEDKMNEIIDAGVWTAQIPSDFKQNFQLHKMSILEETQEIMPVNIALLFNLFYHFKDFPSDQVSVLVNLARLIMPGGYLFLNDSSHKKNSREGLLGEKKSVHHSGLNSKELKKIGFRRVRVHYKPENLLHNFVFQRLPHTR